MRDWATFGLGSQIDPDTPEIREALARRLNDQDRDTRLEALVSLAKRKDDRVLKPLLAELSSDQDVAELALTAAEALADPALCQALLGLTGSARAAASAAIQACGCQVP